MTKVTRLQRTIAVCVCVCELEVDVSHANAQAEERIKEESSNCEASYKDTLAKLEQALNFALIENHMESLQATFKSMLTADRQQGESHSTLTYDSGTHAHSLWRVRVCVCVVQI